MRWCRFGRGLVALALGLAVVGWSPAEQPPVTCTASTLSVTLGPGEGAAGTTYAPLRFTNTGSRTCVTQGFPGVSYLTEDGGAQVGRTALREGAPGGTVTLAPGAVASAALAMVRVENYDPVVCRPTPVKGLRVFPPGQRVPVWVPLDATVCAGNLPSQQLRIATIKPA